MTAGTAHSTRAGIVALVAACVLFAMVDGISKVLVAEHSFGQIMLARYVPSLAVLFLVAPAGKRLSMFRSAYPGLQLLRALMPVAVGGLMVIAVMFMPLAEATVILFACPFIVLALSGLFLGEKVGSASWLGVAIGFAAVLVVARPGLEGLSVYALLPAAAAFFFAGLQLLSRKVGNLGEAAETSMAWTIIAGLIIALPLAILDWRPPTSQNWVWLVLLGACFGGAQYTLAKAFVLAPANVLAPLTYSQIPAAVLFGLVVFGDVPDAFTSLGIAMILLAGLIVYRATRT